ncbi:hypothetical protein JR316_0007437 [Psilocybe cubensis]|uniref:Uncharacterized protein n=2 Tax=Psilocybe cubensis TaxID=181762 RepID=A0ACB8GYM1_PSICU|nr:hypothetical protein JR316_0007437 [Psilocybe cubensis]KAH9480835.1 hypothetical protein JR316_0007437 [Psilocybe cubensis]
MASPMIRTESSQSESHTRTETFSSQTTYTSNGTFVQTPSSSGFQQAPKVPLEAGPAYVPYTDTIPPVHPFRTLVLCFDGTGDQFDADNSNIVEFFAMLKKDDPEKQLVYYQAGIGTYTTPQIATPFMSKISQTLDMMIAWNLDAHIMGGYEFLMQNYRAGDRICIFGFSRGAYTARCLAGMIHKVGLLPTCNHQQVPFAYKMYTQADDVGWKQSNAFKKTFSIDVDIEFLGVWDTVSSVGLIPRRLPFTTSNTVVKTFRHAVSLDERRAKFKANHWNKPNKTEATLSITDKKAKKEHEGGAHKKKKDGNGKNSLKSLENQYAKDKNAETDIDEVWFAGCHCDIGGGSVATGVKPNLARIPIRWMIRECFKTNSGIMFHTDGLKGINLDPDMLYPVVRPRPPPLSAGTTGPTAYIKPTPKEPEVAANDDDYVASDVMAETEEEAELKDALAPIYDQLSLAWGWWILELLPLRHRTQESDDGSWTSWFYWNLGRGRHVPKQKKKGVRVHRSVKIRLDAKYPDGSPYIPKADLNESYITWVD